MLQDLRYALRILRKSPGFTAVAIAALALGIGANTAIFSVVNAVLLRPLPLTDPDRLALVYEEASFIGFPHNTPAPGNYAEWKKQNQVFEDMAAMRGRSYSLTGAGGEPEKLRGAAVTANFFPVVGVKPALGRVFLEEEDRPGGANVVVIGAGLWKRRFAADPRLVGQAIELDGQKFNVVGVMPAGFQVPPGGTEFWVPSAFTPRDLGNRWSHYLHVLARLKAGVTVGRAQGEMSVIARRLEQQYPDSNKNIGAVVVPLRDEFVGDVRRGLIVLLAAVAAVLLIACANIANLLLARATARQREIAVRTALGAGRLRVVRQLLTESVLLAAAGGVLGGLLATWTFAFLSNLIPPSLTGSAALNVDLRVLGFSALVSLLTGVLFGLAPALQVSRLDLGDALKQGGARSGAGGRGHRLRDALVVWEVASALVLLISAGLLIRTFSRLRGIDPGFRAENVLTASTALPRPKYSDFSKRVAFFEQVLERIKTLPGVVSAGYTTAVPLTMRGGTNGFTIEGRPYRPGSPVQDSNIRVVTPEYLQTIGVVVRRGRFLDEHDTAQSQPVAVINEAMAKKFWPGEDALGKRFKLGSDTATPWVTIAGIVGDVRQMALENPGRQEMYFPLRQSERYWAVPQDLAIRTAGDPMKLANAVRREVQAVDPDQPVSSIRTMDEIVDLEVAQRRFHTLLLGGFAALALLLASLGIYGVLSYAVTQRTQEIGIRVALGAQRSDVLGLVVRDGAKLALIGIGLGLAAAYGLTRVMASLLYGVSATDPLTFGLVTLLLLAVAIAASYIPARRATRVDPMVALRYE